ncbi:MAG: Two-component response regulator [Candidatus Uhrbacteria bacterium GW2011_GWE2_40_58]|nr:MAG: Two-component response regulator [Candidatus Uhrbacteria bacterium GW2011_GWF2_40_263]KKR67890.1 MAG: Two-component response regulator [Candidatus Uhrbacteria bacterium GW2011_GWE2_40_58]OGL96859.1 MAG: hypothetical protein A2332_01945 [Candidatus Uhrbacteria bacterium RIFOXYB2_FULL_41_18]HBK34545.1 response regulator [Candidatus Uhrbacteria bacterium]HCB55896.1 response regulator [Candidatus Uhrbacteria bacterium]
MSEEQTILIAEDDHFLSNIYQTKLKKEGFQVLIAKDGEEALSLIQEKKPSVVLLDIMMSKLDGFGVLEEMQKDKDLKKIPVIIMSNLGQDSDVQKGKELGAKDYIIKSDTTLVSVVETIRKYL